MAKKRIFTQTEIDQILDKFDNGQSMESLQKEFHTRKIRDILTENNREIKQGGKRINSGSKYKYTFNESYFEKIDSVEKAYWLGFIYADGYITRKTSGQAHLCLCLSEEEPINKFKKAINTNKPTNSFDAKNSYNNTISKAFRITIIFDKIVNDIEKLGVVENKSLILTFPTWLETTYIPHFIRGYFDGDGSVFLTKNNYLYSEILGTESFLKELQKHLIFLDSNKISKDSRENVNCFRLRLSSEKLTLDLYKYLYKDCGEYSDNYLSRKKDKFEKYIKEKGSTTIITHPN